MIGDLRQCRNCIVACGNCPDIHRSNERMLEHTRDALRVLAAERDGARSLALLVSDALAFTGSLTYAQKEVLIRALRAVATETITTEIESGFFQEMLDVGCQVTAPFDPERYKL